MNPTQNLILIICLFGLGCQRYSSRPLDLKAHQEEIRGRDPAAAEVAAYARQLIGTRPAEPAAYDPTDGLTLSEGEVVALFFNPHLRTARLKARVPLVGAAEAGRWADPELRVDGERIIESVERPWVIGGVLNLTLPLSGRLGAEKNKAMAEADVERMRVLVAEQKLLAELRMAWLAWSATREQASLTRALLSELDRIVESAEKLRAVGELDPLDARLFRIERLTQMGKLQMLEAQARGEEIELKSRLGLAPMAQIGLIPSLELTQRQVPTTQEATSSIENHPRVRLARAEYEVSERALHLEIRKQYPDLDIGGGFGTDEGNERVLGGLGLPLPLWNQNRRSIAEAKATREALRAAAEGEYEQLLADLVKAHIDLDGAMARVRFVESELAPLVDEQLATARKLEKLGNYNTLILLESIKASYDAKFEVVQARLKLGLANARIRALMDRDTAVSGTGKDVQP